MHFPASPLVHRAKLSLFGPAHRATVFCISAVALLGAGSLVHAQTLVANPFISPYTGWVDPVPSLLGNWRLSLHNPTLMDTNNLNPPNTGAVVNSGTYLPDLLIQNNFVAPGTYDLTARMMTSDDDLLGLVWNYQDPNNYFRVGIRQQPSSGTFGATQDLAVQKIVNGVVTQISPNGTGPGVPAITQPMIDARTPFDLKVSVNGSNYSVLFNGATLVSGTDADLASGRKVGVQSWAQQSDVAGVTPFWGTEVESLSVTQGATTLHSTTFNQRPVKWRQMNMKNAAGVTVLNTASRDDIGNFGLDINDPWVLQHSNGAENATFGNVDFIGPSVVVDEAGATSMSNYDMRVRLGAADDDGYGVLVRVQDDDNFYRVNFAREVIGAGAIRAPRGLSVQKVRNGVWSEVYRDDQTTPLFIPPIAAAGTNPGSGSFAAFDVSVGVVGNSMKIQVRDQGGNVINYPLITDSNDPILTGSVGITNWGTENTYYTNYGGTAGPMVTAITGFTTLDATIDRATGAISIKNNGNAPLAIDGIKLTSAGGGLNAATWTPVANAYDEAPGNGSVDPNDPWTIVSSTPFELSEAEQSVGGDGGSIGVGQTITLGNAWTKSIIEDVAIELTLTTGVVTPASVAFSGTPYARADLNTDGVVSPADWPLFVSNLLSDVSALSDVAGALKGDFNADGAITMADYVTFKNDYDTANGVGAFQAMIASVPEPSTLSLLLGGALAVVARTRRRTRQGVAAVAAVGVITAAQSAHATPLDFTTFTLEGYTPSMVENGTIFTAPVWTATPSNATHNTNGDASVFYSPTSAMNKRFIGRVTPRSDDDAIGFVLGFDPGDAQTGSSADYLLIDWKGATQTTNFVDPDIFTTFHFLTPGGEMPVGLALSRVTGGPTADEMWQHENLPEDSSGGVAELARGTTLGASPYNRLGGSHLFDITYTSTNVKVVVDGVEQFNIAGSFPDGRFGLYSGWQSPPPVFDSFEVLPTTGFDGLSLTVDRANGAVTLRNTGSVAVELDYYQVDSVLNSLNVTGWNSLSDQNFQSVGAGNGQSWDEAGGSDANSLGEAFLLANSTIAGNATIPLGTAYNNSINGEDLTFTYRLPSGLVLNGAVNYIGEAPGGLAGDYDNDNDVDGADFLVWQRSFGAVGSNPADGSGNNIVDAADLTIWKDNFGSVGVVASAAAVPEPSSLALLLVGGVAARRWRR